MPWNKLEDVPANVKTHKGVNLTLTQANQVAAIADKLEADGSANPWGVAWSTFDKVHVVRNGAWVKKSDMAEEDEEEQPCGCGKHTAHQSELSDDPYSELVAKFDVVSAKVVELGKGEKKAKVAVLEGLALAEGEWKGVFYPWEEIRKSVNSLLGTRVHFEHQNTTAEQVKGFVSRVSLNLERKGINATVVVNDPVFVNLVANDQLSIGGEKGIGFSVQVRMKLEKGAKGKAPRASNLSYGELTITGSPACKICRLTGGHVQELSETEGSEMPEEDTTTESASTEEQADPAGATSVDAHADALNSLQAAQMAVSTGGLPETVTLAVQAAVEAVEKAREGTLDTSSENENAEHTEENSEEEEASEEDVTETEELSEDVQEENAMEEESSESESAEQTLSNDDIVARVTAQLSDKYDKAIAELTAENKKLSAERDTQWATEEVESLMQLGAVIPANKQDMIEHLCSLKRDDAQKVVDMLSKQTGNGMLFSEEAEEVADGAEDLSSDWTQQYTVDPDNMEDYFT